MSGLLWPANIEESSADTATYRNFRRPPAKPEVQLVLEESSLVPSTSEETDDRPTSIINVTEVIHLDGSPNSNTEKGTYILCPMGDVLVKLTYESSEVCYLVSAQILRLVSPVWSKCLDPDSPFKTEVEIDNGGNTVMRLKDDDPDCLLNIFRCVHFQTSDVPPTVDFEYLKSLAVICDKYDCAKALKPWLAGWLTPWHSRALDPGYEDWLFISKIFDDNRNVEELISLLAENTSSLSVCGSYFRRGDLEVPTTLIPDSILDRVVTQREKMVLEITSKFCSSIKDFLHKVDLESGGCLRDGCLSLVYGSLLRSVRRSGLWPLLNDKEVWHGSVKDLKHSLQDITYITLTDRSLVSISPYYSYHNHLCRLGLEKTQTLNLLRGA
ncbi:hypothetical protein TWF506_008204 [Arthrobotrys conoides]|uniref:BTB domain-containing protein n=1 Tax=Arthrobotrys conoides TaxID=74498 RepID=A0AAN8RY05_9PEZI